MIPYSFSVLRYTHDGVTSEFVNVGVALSPPDNPYLAAKCTSHYGRISRLFDRIDGERFKQLMKYIEEELNRAGAALKQHPLPFVERGNDMDALLSRVLPKDDSALQFSPAGYGVSLDLAQALSELYERYVERYADSQEPPSRSDDEVWRVFKERLERRQISSFLAPKK